VAACVKGQGHVRGIAVYHFKQSVLCDVLLGMCGWAGQTGANKRKKGRIMTRLAGKVALVTGAGMGLGAAIAEAMVREGASVVCADINRDATEAVADKLQNAGGQAAFQELDVTDEAAWEAVVQRTQDVFGGIDIVVNNAGVAPVGKMIEDLTLDEWRRTLSIDLDYFLNTWWINSKHLGRYKKCKTKNYG